MRRRWFAARQITVTEPVGFGNSQRDSSLAAFATRSAAPWRLHVGVKARFLAPEGVGHIRQSVAHTEPSLVAVVA